MQADATSPRYDQIVERLKELNPEACLMLGFETALVGLGSKFNDAPVAIYDYDKCIALLTKRDGMTEIEAEEYMDFNETGAWVGEGTPIFANLWTEATQ